MVRSETRPAKSSAFSNVGIKKAEFLTAADKTLQVIVSATLLVMLLTGAIGLYVVHRVITRPFDASISVMDSLVAGNHRDGGRSLQRGPGSQDTA